MKEEGKEKSSGKSGQFTKEIDLQAGLVGCDCFILYPEKNYLKEENCLAVICQLW